MQGSARDVCVVVREDGLGLSVGKYYIGAEGEGEEY